MAGALAAAPVDNGRIRRLQNGSYVDTATGKRYASYKDIPKGKANFGDPAAMRSSIRSNMGPSTAAYDTTGAPDVLDYMSGNTDILGALGATPANDQIPMAGASAARNPQPAARPVAAGPQGALAAAAPVAAPYFGGPGGTPFPGNRPLAAADTGAESASPLAGMMPMPNQAAHMPGPGGALSPTPDTEAAPVIQGDSGGDMLSAGAGMLKGKGALAGTALGDTKGIKPTIKGAVEPSSSSGGALSSAPDVTKGLDLTKGLGALTQQNPLTAVEHDPSWMEKIGGAIGLRKAGPSTSGSGAFDGLFDDPDRMAMLEAGLGTMAAAGQPGATLGGALGYGGLGALHNRDERQERADKTKEAKLRLDTETARYDADRAERAQFHGDENRHWNDTNARETNRDKASAAQALVTNTQKDRELTQAEKAEAAREKDNAALRGIEGRNAASTEANRESEEEDRKSKRFNAAFVRAQGKSVNSITGLLQLDDPTKAPPTVAEARRAAALEVPDAPESKQYAADQLGKYKTALALAKAKGDTAAMTQAQQGIDLITSKFNLKPRK